MPEYVKKALDRLQHPKPKRPQYAPHFWTVPAYGKILQIVPDPDYSNLLDKKATNIIQSIVGTMLYYGRSVDPTMSRAINEILRVQSKPTRDTEKNERMILDYSATYPNEFIRYKSSDMILHVDSYAEYITIP